LWRGVQKPTDAALHPARNFIVAVFVTIRLLHAIRIRLTLGKRSLIPPNNLVTKSVPLATASFSVVFPKSS
jgi:hypothetical protein